MERALMALKLLRTLSPENKVETTKNVEGKCSKPAKQTRKRRLMRGRKKPRESKARHGSPRRMCARVSLSSCLVVTQPGIPPCSDGISHILRVSVDLFIYSGTTGLLGDASPIATIFSHALSICAALSGLAARHASLLRMRLRSSWNRAVVA